MAIADLVVRFSADVRSLREGFTEAQRGAHGLADTFNDLGKALTVGLTAPLALAAGATVLAARDMDGLRRGLTAVAGSAEETERQLTRLQEVAKLPGLGFREAIRGSISLQAAGFSASMAERSLMAFGNALATVGKGKADLDGVTLALTQIASKGKISAEEINQLSERVPQVRKAMQAAFGTADTEKLQKSGLSATAFVEGLVAQLNKLPQVTGGVGNAFENMSDALFRAKAAMGEALLPAVIPLIEGLAGILVQVRSINPETLRTVIAFGAVAAAVGPLVLVIGSLITGVTALATALSIGLLPLIVAGGPILIALGLLAAAFVKAGLDSLAAAADAEAAAGRFRAALSAMNDATLSSTLQAKESSTNALIRSRNALQQEVESLRAALPKETTEPRQVMSARVGGTPSAAGRALQDAARRQSEALSTNAAALAQIRQKEALVTNLNEMIQTRTGELGAISQELNARQTRAVATPPLNLNGPGGADKLRGVRDTVDDVIRRLQTLSRFGGALNIDLLPDNIADKIHAFETIRDQADRLSDALARMGSAAPPSALRWLEQLRAQVRGAGQEIADLGKEFNTALRQMATRTITTTVNVGTTVFQQGVRQSVENQLVFDRGLGVTGRLLGALDARMSPVAVALTGLREAALIGGRSLIEALGQTATAAGQFAGNLQQRASALLRGGASLGQAAPPALAFASAMEVATGFFQALAPAMESLTLPLRMMGEVLSALIIPVLKVMFPVFKAVAIVASFLGEMIARVVGAILNAAGGFVKGLGKLINAITPFANPGNPLVKAGESLQRTAHEFGAAADEMKDKRKELQHLSWEDAMDRASGAADKLADSLTNVPPLFDIALRRIQAARGQTPESLLPTPTGAPAPVLGSLSVVFQPGAIQSSGSATAKDIAVEVTRQIVTRLGTVPNEEARDLATTLRMAMG